ncbi:MAG: transglutaminase domain-containing protein, partial [Cyanobacteriota bacterium]
MKFRFIGLIIFVLTIVLLGNNLSTLAEQAFTKDPIPSPTGISSYNYWYAKYLNNVKVGYTHEIRGQENLEGRPVVTTSSDSYTKLKRVNSIIESKDNVKYYETPGGKPIKFTQETSSGESQSSKIEGIVNGDKLEITSTTYGNTSKSNIILEGNVIFPNAIDNKYKRNTRSDFKYKTILPDLGGSVVNVDVKYIETEPTNVLRETFTLNKYEVRYDALPSLIIHEWRDDYGVIFKTTLSLMNEAHFLVSEEEAKYIDARKQVDIIEDSMVLTNQTIPDPRDLQYANYVIRIKDGDFNLEDIFITDNRQKIKSKTINELNLEVNAYLPDYLLYVYPFTNPLLKAYLKDNNYIQPSHPAIKTKALEIVGNQKNAYLAAKALEKWVNKNIKDKNFDVGMATASDALESGKGDCTEHAVLLASLCRSLGIPTKVVVGLAYIPIPGSDKGSFAFHMWNEVFVGEWIQLDSALPSKDVADAARIELAKSTMNNPEEVGKLLTSPVSIIGNLEIDIIDYSSRSSGHLDIENKASNQTVEFDLSELVASGIEDYYAPLQNINLDKFKKETGIVDKFNVTGLPNTSPILETYEGYFTKGLAIYSKGDIEKSLLYFKKAASFIPENNAKQYYDLGVRLAGIMVFDIAKEQFEKAAALNDELWSSKARHYLEDKFPKGSYTNSSQMNNMTGFSFANFASNYPAALLMYEKAVDESPEFDSALYNLGTMYALQNDFNKALENYNKAVNINSRNPMIYAGLGN